MKAAILKLAAVFGAAAFLFATGFAKAEDYPSGNAGYLKSATYYSDAWVVNFWNSESSNMDGELAQIASDGFNNIILAVPWREFQPGTGPLTYNSYAWDKLDRVMNAAAKHNLTVMLRVGYTWDYYGRDNVLDRYTGLMYDTSIRTAWLAYVERLYKHASAHENFSGGFLTWEDFWNFTDSSTTLGNGSDSKKLARQYGYTDYAKKHYTLKELGGMYNRPLDSYDDLYFPGKDSYARKVFYGFYDQFLNQLLADSQTVFPGLSMEVRLDVDPVKHWDGSQEGFMHSSTYPSQSAAYTSTMYSIPMGFANQYERVTAGEALEKFPGFMERIQGHNGGKPIYIDQFLFTDNTVGFEHNAQLLDDQKELYLEGLAPLLKRMTMGYGIWTYRDYADNKLYNSQFALGQEGWRFSGRSSVVEREGSAQAMLTDGAGIYQNIGHRMTGTVGNDTMVRFQVEGEGSCKLTVQVGNQSRTVEAGNWEILEDGNGNTMSKKTVEIKFNGNDATDFSIKAAGGTAYVDNIQVFTVVTKGELYHMDGSQGSCIRALRSMNQKL